MTGVVQNPQADKQIVRRPPIPGNFWSLHNEALIELRLLSKLDYNHKYPGCKRFRQEIALITWTKHPHLGVFLAWKIFHTTPKLWITREKLWKTGLNWGKLIRFPFLCRCRLPPYMGGHL